MPRDHIKIITNLLNNIYTERINLLNKMYELQKDNSAMEKLLQMQLLRLLSDDIEFDDSKQPSDAYR